MTVWFSCVNNKEHLCPKHRKKTCFIYSVDSIKDYNTEMSATCWIDLLVAVIFKNSSQTTIVFLICNGSAYLQPESIRTRPRERAG